MIDKLREAVKELKEMIKANKERFTPPLDNITISLKTAEVVVSTLQAVIDAEMPGKIYPPLENLEGRHNADGYNQALPDYCPLIAKKDLEIAELKEQLYDWQYQLAYFTYEAVATPHGVKSFVMTNNTEKEYRIRKQKIVADEAIRLLEENKKLKAELANTINIDEHKEVIRQMIEYKTAFDKALDVNYKLEVELDRVTAKVKELKDFWREHTDDVWGE